MKRIFTGLIVGLLLWGCSEDEQEFLTFEEQLALDVQIIDQYLADNNITAIEDPTGLRYVINNEGDGDPVTLMSKVEVEWTGKLLDDRIYDETTDGAEQYELTSTPFSWAIAMPYIKEGGSITLYVPSGLAFGQQSGGIVTANSNIIFEIDLIAVHPRSIAFQQQLDADTAIINKYLLDSGIVDTQIDPSGLIYKIHMEGSGDGPSLINQVTVKYKGTLMDGTVFDQAEAPVQFYLTQLILGWQIGFQLLNPGTVATLYLPSGMAYGTNGSGAIIGPNQPLIFEVELVSIE